VRGDVPGKEKATPVLTHFMPENELFSGLAMQLSKE
jgi:hypothetical protein